MVEQQPFKLTVGGSSPPARTMKTIIGKKTKVAVLAGGPSSEKEVSLMTAQNIINNLNKKLYDIRLITIDNNKNWMVNHYVKSPKHALKGVDVVINALHGEYGEDGQIQAILNKIGIPYTGSGPIASALAMDKLISRHLFKKSGLLTPNTLNYEFNKILDFKALQNEITGYFNLPVVIKPNSNGSSLGINIVKYQADIPKAIRQAAEFDKTILVEEYLKGVEISCGVVETKSGMVGLPPIMILPKKEFFNYAAKYNPSLSEEITPAPLTEELIKRIKTIAVFTHKLLGLRYYSRTDMLLVKDKVYILETNSLPGLTKASLIPKTIEVWGVGFPRFLDHLIDLALTSQISIASGVRLSI